MGAGPLKSTNRAPSCRDHASMYPKVNRGNTASSALQNLLPSGHKVDFPKAYTFGSADPTWVGQYMFTAAWTSQPRHSTWFEGECHNFKLAQAA